MKKKLQVFISSTYKDLIEERQAAVESILNAGHIPAGMELFKAGNESQLETVKRWIDESDVYLLILGGRYGSIERGSQKSYTHIEYEYALEKGIPVFSLVVNDQSLNDKVKKYGQEVLELDNQDAYRSFRELALSKMCSFFDDLKDIKIAVHETLVDFQIRYSFTGWVSGKDIPNVEQLLSDNLKLLKENTELKSKIEKQKITETASHSINGRSYDDIKNVLANIMVPLPEELAVEKKDTELSVLDLFFSMQDAFATGVSNSANSSKSKTFLFFHVAPKLMIFNLVEKVKVSGVQWQRIHTSKDGLKFFSISRTRKIISNNRRQPLLRN